MSHLPTFSRVHSHPHLRWGEEVAIKLIKRGNIEKVARQIKVQREIDVLRVSVDESVIGRLG